MDKGVALPMGEKVNSLKVEKKRAITAARQLCYSKNVISRLENAENVAEISNIMHNARTGKLT